MTYDTDVLIAGAGPTGLTLAVDLARRDVKARLIDTAEKPREGSRGRGVQARTQEVFDDLGIVEAITAAGAAYPRMRLHYGPFWLDRPSLGPYIAKSESTPHPMLWMVPQARTEAILRQRLEALGGKVEFGTTLQSFTHDADGVEAQLSNGTKVRAKYLVGADGGHSTVRRALALELKGESIDDREMMVADIEVDGLSREVWHIWLFAHGGMVGLCPVPHANLFQFTSPTATAADGIEAAVRKYAGRRVPRIAWQSSYRPSVRMVDRYRVGRVLLAGDAAHVHPPAGGQGLNTGVQDAYNLGWKIASAVKSGDETLLDTYEKERLPIAAAVLGLSKKLHLSGSPQRGASTNQLSLHYRDSPLSTGERFGSLHPGDRMPDMRLDDGSRLFERMRGPHATDLVTPEGVRIFIRPDGYVANIGRTRFAAYANVPVQEIRSHVNIP